MDRYNLPGSRLHLNVVTKSPQASTLALRSYYRPNMGIWAFLMLHMGPRMHVSVKEAYVGI